jgi:hypothetical protein
MAWSHGFLLLSLAAVFCSASISNDDSCSNGQCSSTPTNGVNDDEVTMLQVSLKPQSRKAEADDTSVEHSESQKAASNITAAMNEVAAAQAVCVAYSEQACRDAAGVQGLQLGGQGYDFTGSYGVKGCYTYSSGKYKGYAYYGTGGSTAAMQLSPAAPKVRVPGYDCPKPESPGYATLDGDCWGNDLKPYVEDKSVSECAEICTCDDNCAGFSYLLGSSWKYRCIPKSKGCSSLTQSGFTFYSKQSASKLASLSCSDKSTPANSDGKVVRRFRRDIPPNVRYLDRHNLKCGANSVLSKIQLRSLGGNKIKYNYKCCSVPAGLLGSVTSRDSGLNSDGGGDARYLDRHMVKCQPNELMTQVKLGSYGGGKIRYNYKCASVKFGGCSLHSTQANDDGKGNLRYLDRHNIECPAGKGLKRFKMIRVGSRKYRFEYRCCTVSKC